MIAASELFVIEFIKAGTATWTAKQWELCPARLMSSHAAKARRPTKVDVWSETFRTMARINRNRRREGVRTAQPPTQAASWEHAIRKMASCHAKACNHDAWNSWCVNTASNNKKRRDRNENS